MPGDTQSWEGAGMMKQRSARSVGILAAALVAAGLTGCGADDVTGTGTAEPVVEIATDLPLLGGKKPIPVEQNNAVKLYLEQHGNKAGRFRVSLRTYDNGSVARGKWDDQLCVQNAALHLRSAEVGVLGPTNSGCARLQVPVLNGAVDTPMLSISESATNPGLTKSWEPGDPKVFAPSGKRSFARVAYTDDQQGAVAAVYAARTLKAKRCFVINDGDVFGRGVSKAFVESAKANGISIVANTTFDRGHSSFTDIFEAVKGQQPECVYLGALIDDQSKQVVADKVKVLGDNTAVPMLAPDGMAGDKEFDARPTTAGLYLTPGGMPIKELVRISPTAATFFDSYRARYGVDAASNKTIRMISALQVLMAAIEASDGTRAGVHRAVFGSTDLTVPAAVSITGKAVTIDHATGDPTSVDVAIAQVRGGQEVFVTNQTID